MKDEKFLEQIQEVNRLREHLDATGPVFSPAKTKADVLRIYGRENISRDTWNRWCLKCTITPALLERYQGNYPSGGYLLLMVNAKLLRGNGPQERSRKVTRPMLVRAIKRHQQLALATSEQNLPARLRPIELIEYAEAQAGRTYHRRSHQRKGIHQSKPFYTRDEAVRILSRYPVLQVGA